MTVQTERCQRPQQVDVTALIARSRLVAEINRELYGDMHESVPSRLRRAIIAMEAVLPVEERRE